MNRKMNPIGTRAASNKAVRLAKANIVEDSTSPFSTVYGRKELRIRLEKALLEQFVAYNEPEEPAPQWESLTGVGPSWVACSEGIAKTLGGIGFPVRLVEPEMA